MEILKNKIYCITGGGGFISNYLIDDIISKGGIVRTIGNNKKELLLLKDKYSDKIEIIIGDIKILKNVKKLIIPETIGLFHLAAFKYVGLAEKNPKECINSNIIGTLNVLNISVKNKLQFVMASSTSISVQNSTVYGSTKMLMEKLFNQYQNENTNIKFKIVRFGNVLYSTGSVSQKWRDSIIKGEDIVISNGESTRFFMSIKQTIHSIYMCLESESPYIPNVKSMSLNNLLNAMVMKYGIKNKNVNIITSVLREGENNHEKLSNNGLYSNEVEQYTISEILNII